MDDIYCSKCGEKNSISEDYCIECGSILRKLDKYESGDRITSFEDMFTLLLGYLWYMLAVIVLLLGILACLTLHIYSIYDSYKSIKKITNGESVEDIMFFNKFM